MKVGRVHKGVEPTSPPPSLFGNCTFHGVGGTGSGGLCFVRVRSLELLLCVQERRVRTESGLWNARTYSLELL